MDRQLRPRVASAPDPPPSSARDLDCRENCAAAIDPAARSARMHAALVPRLHRWLAMDERMALLGLLLSGFFAVACIRASVPVTPGSGASVMNLLRFPGRIERLRRSRWQWFAMVSFMIVLRLQQQLPLVLELMAALQFLLFLALPARTTAAPVCQLSDPISGRGGSMSRRSAHGGE